MNHASHITLGPPLANELLAQVQRLVAAQSTDAGDCRELLSMLGLLDPDLAQHLPRRQPPTPVAKPEPVRRVVARWRSPEFQAEVAQLRAVEARSWTVISRELHCSAATARQAWAQVEFVGAAQ